jgi:hypothetical protein
MRELDVTHTSGGSLCLFDERGTLIGIVQRPVARDPIGPGRETVYLARLAESDVAPAAA